MAEGYCRIDTCSSEQQANDWCAVLQELGYQAMVVEGDVFSRTTQVSGAGSQLKAAGGPATRQSAPWLVIAIGNSDSVTASPPST